MPTKNKTPLEGRCEKENKNIWKAKCRRKSSPRSPLLPHRRWGKQIQIETEIYIAKHKRHTDRRPGNNTTKNKHITRRSSETSARTRTAEKRGDQQYPRWKQNRYQKRHTDGIRRTTQRNNPARRRKLRSRPRRGQLKQLPTTGEMKPTRYRIPEPPRLMCNIQRFYIAEKLPTIQVLKFDSREPAPYRQIWRRKISL